MRTSLAGIFFLIMAHFAMSCYPNTKTDEENIQREEEIRIDDIREEDSFNKNVPVNKKEIEEDEEDLTREDFGPGNP